MKDKTLSESICREIGIHHSLEHNNIVKLFGMFND